MNKNESKYFSTAEKMDKAFLHLLEKKDYAYITVKEVCSVAQVNRSTFYLHYENMDDLLCEAITYMNRRFSAYMKDKNGELSVSLENSPIDELYLVTPKYLTPYLGYIKEEKRLFVTALKNTKTLRMDESYEKMFNSLILPILERYRVPEENRRYIVSFYIHGMMAIISEWLKNDCKESIEHITNLITQCVSQPKNRNFVL